MYIFVCQCQKLFLMVAGILSIQRREHNNNKITKISRKRGIFSRKIMNWSPFTIIGIIIYSDKKKITIKRQHFQSYFIIIVTIFSQKQRQKTVSNLKLLISWNKLYILILPYLYLHGEAKITKPKHFKRLNIICYLEILTKNRNLWLDVYPIIIYHFQAVLCNSKNDH